MGLRRVLVTGAAGQLGRTLVARAPAGIELRALDRAGLDVADTAAVARELDGFAPDVLVNASAYTAVDRAEQQPELAARANALGPRVLAEALATRGARLLHVSTDYVFDGRGSSPYAPDAAPAPLGVYGRSKLEGERAVAATLGARATIVRTAWVYSASGPSFLQTMLRLMRERGAVRVVDDQVGTPTATGPLADALWQLAARDDLGGIHHWTDAGTASWYDFAVAIAEDAFARGLLAARPSVTPIATHEYPTPARRPAYGVLDKRTTWTALEVEPVHWRTRLREVLQEIPVG